MIIVSRKFKTSQKKTYKIWIWLFGILQKETPPLFLVSKRKLKVHKLYYSHMVILYQKKSGWFKQNSRFRISYIFINTIGVFLQNIQSFNRQMSRKIFFEKISYLRKGIRNFISVWSISKTLNSRSMNQF